MSRSRNEIISKTNWLFFGKISKSKKSLKYFLARKIRRLDVNIDLSNGNYYKKFINIWCHFEVRGYKFNAKKFKQMKYKRLARYPLIKDESIYKDWYKYYYK